MLFFRGEDYAFREMLHIRFKNIVFNESYCFHLFSSFHFFIISRLSICLHESTLSGRGVQEAQSLGIQCPGYHLNFRGSFSGRTRITIWIFRVHFPAAVRVLGWSIRSSFHGDAVAIFMFSMHESVHEGRMHLREMVLSSKDPLVRPADLSPPS